MNWIMATWSNKGINYFEKLVGSSQVIIDGSSFEKSKNQFSLRCKYTKLKPQMLWNSI